MNSITIDLLNDSQSQLGNNKVVMQFNKQQKEAQKGNAVGLIPNQECMF